MSEQQQQDGDSEYSTYTNTITDKEAMDDTVKVHKARRHHKRHKKSSSSEYAVPQTIRVDTEGMTSKETVHNDMSAAAEKSTDTEKTPSIAVESEKIAETPLPPPIEENEVIETSTHTPLPDASVGSTPIETSIDTPLPPSVKETKATPISTEKRRVSTTAAVSTIEEPVVPRTPSTESFAVVPSVKKRSRTTRNTQLVYALLALLLISTVFLWQDLTATHLYVNTIDAVSGNIHSQQDLGGYRDAVSLTAPLAAHATSSVLLGLYANNAGGVQQLLTLRNTASTLSLQRSVSLANRTVTYAANGSLLVESANGLQVIAQNGRMLWHIQSQQPTRGVHPFQPVSDAQEVYTIKSVTHSQVAAYNLRNGHTHWTQTLNDTLEYAPPFLLNRGILYIASDHNLFALNSSDGTVLWEKPYASRTLLLENEGGNSLLIALGPQGIQALQSDSGEVIWEFRGNPDVSTLPTQFYQGSIGSIQNTTSNTLYATGIVWQMPQVRESVWLYAVDAMTGRTRWSQQIASGPLGVDAGRGLQPLLDVHNGQVVVQRVVSGKERDLTAYDANTGGQRWNTYIEDRNTSSPIVLQVSQHMLAFFTTTTHSDTILWTPSLYRACMLLLLLVCVIGLLILLSRRQKQQHTQSIAQYVVARFTALRRHWRYAYTFLTLALLLVSIGVSLFAYARSEQLTRQLLTTDAQGSIVVTNTGDNLRQLEALGPDGTVQWKLFSSEGVFSLPAVHVQPNTLLVALHGHAAGKYHVAEDDPAYPRPLDALLALYVLNRSTGQTLWQHIVSYPDEQQNTQVIGADATYIYVAGEHVITSSSDMQNTQTTQLFAVNKATGAIDWRIFGPTQSAKTHIHSTLLLKNGQAFWHIADTTFTIDTSVGQIIARK